MNAQSKIETATGLDLLRLPFPPRQISKLPKETGTQAKQRKADMDNNKWPPKCEICGGFHHVKAVHLDYVGHAALTDRLLDADPNWGWEPAGLTPEGLPAIGNGGLWIKLTVCGVTRYGFGAADGKSGGDAIKEMIGDALRNSAMRFGAALDLWHKGDLHAEDDEPKADAPKPTRQEAIAAHKDDPFPPGPAKNKTSCKDLGRELWRDVEGCGDEGELIALLNANADLIKQIRLGLTAWWSGGMDREGQAFEGLEQVIERKKRDVSELETARVRNPITAG